MIDYTADVLMLQYSTNFICDKMNNLQEWIVKLFGRFVKLFGRFVKYFKRFDKQFERFDQSN